LTGLFGRDAKNAAIKGAIDYTEIPTFQKVEFDKSIDEQGKVNAKVYADTVKGTVLDMWADPAGAMIDVLMGGGGRLIPGVKNAIKAGEARKIAKASSDMRKYASKKFLRAVQPPQSKAISRTMLNKYSNNLSLAADTIIENADNLKYLDETGAVVSQGIPKNLDEFSSAIAQTKTRIFNEYDSLAKQAGNQGAVVDLRPIVNEVKALANNPTIKVNFPEISNYAKKYASRMSNEGFLTLDQADETLKALNNSLKSYYAKGSYAPDRVAQVDVLIKNLISKKTDEVISARVGEGYSALKKRYGALRAIEEDVNKSLFKNLKKPKAGITDLIDAYSASNIIIGMASGRVGQTSKGLIVGGTKKIIDATNNPNTSVDKMFKALSNIKQGNYVLPGKTRAVLRGIKDTAKESVKIGSVVARPISRQPEGN
jgi:hypothetical protein